MCRARIANELSSASSQSSGGADRRWIALFQQVFLLAAQHELVPLVVHSHRDRYDPGRALRLQRCDGAARDIEALADRKILEKPAFRKAVPPPVETFAVGHLSLLPSSFHHSLS